MLFRSADELADRIVVIDHGAVIAEGTSEELKNDMGGRSLVVEVHDLDQLELATELLTRCEDCAVPTMDRQRHTVSLPVEDDTGIAARAISILAEGEVDIADFHLERPSLDDVFLSLTSSGTLPAGSDTSTATEDR